MMTIFNIFAAGFILHGSISNFKEGNTGLAIFLFVVSLFSYAIGYLNYKADIKNLNRNT